MAFAASYTVEQLAGNSEQVRACQFVVHHKWKFLGSRVGRLGWRHQLKMSVQEGQNTVGREEEENEEEGEGLVESEDGVVERDDDGLVKAGEEDKGLLVDKKVVVESKVKMELVKGSDMLILGNETMDWELMTVKGRGMKSLGREGEVKGRKLLGSEGEVSERELLGRIQRVISTAQLLGTEVTLDNR